MHEACCIGSGSLRRRARALRASPRLVPRGNVMFKMLGVKMLTMQFRQLFLQPHLSIVPNDALLCFQTDLSDEDMALHLQGHMRF